MRLPTSSSSWGTLFVSTLLFSANSVWAKKDVPSIKNTDFDFMPLDVSYFDDSDVILFNERGGHDVYRSGDAGESWAKVEGPPHGKLYEMIMHPFDKKRAYYLTRGLEHWSTSDRGKTWESFKTTVQPSPSIPAMSFHFDDPDRIIFNGAVCEGIFFCDEQVGHP